MFTIQLENSRNLRIHSRSFVYSLSTDDGFSMLHSSKLHNTKGIFPQLIPYFLLWSQGTYNPLRQKIGNTYLCHFNIHLRTWIGLFLLHPSHADSRYYGQLMTVPECPLQRELTKCASGKTIDTVINSA